MTALMSERGIPEAHRETRTNSAALVDWANAAFPRIFPADADPGRGADGSRRVSARRAGRRGFPVRDISVMMTDLHRPARRPKARRTFEGLE